MAKKASTTGVGESTPTNQGFTVYRLIQMVTAEEQSKPKWGLTEGQRETLVVRNDGSPCSFSSETEAVAFVTQLDPTALVLLPSGTAIGKGQQGGQQQNQQGGGQQNQSGQQTSFKS